MGAFVDKIRAIEAEFSANDQSLFQKDKEGAGNRARFFSQEGSQAKMQAVRDLGANAYSFCVMLAGKFEEISREAVANWVADLKNLDQDLVGDPEWTGYWEEKKTAHDLTDDQVHRYQQDILHAYRFATALLAFTDLSFTSRIDQSRLSFVQTLNSCIHLQSDHIYEHFILDRREQVLKNITEQDKSNIDTCIATKMKGVVLRTGALINEITGSMREAIKFRVVNMFWGYAYFQAVKTNNQELQEHFKKQVAGNKGKYLTYAYFFAVEADNKAIIDKLIDSGQINADDQSVGAVIALKAMTDGTNPRFFGPGFAASLPDVHSGGSDGGSNPSSPATPNSRGALLDGKNAKPKNVAFAGDPPTPPPERRRGSIFGRFRKG